MPKEINEIKKYQKVFSNIKSELARVVVGQEDVVNGLLRALICNGHTLVEGVPGIAKTLIVKSLAEITGCQFSRIQFTVDLLPTDIVGLTTYDRKKGFTVIKGPVFANFLIADEINRASPRTQSALLEAMQERQVTIGKETYDLTPPFLVMATQNPIESAGVFNLPEAQVDRFLFKLKVYYPKPKEEQKILHSNVTLRKFEDYKIKKITNPKEIIRIQASVNKVFMSQDLEDYIIRIINATRERDKFKTGKYIEYGASPRASIGLFIASKADALIKGKSYVTPENIKAVAHDVLRHRVILNYEGQAENINTDDFITEILSKVPIP
ncbi:MoxR family ATPase [Candidatus Woesearchaeota archaeon]|nr:MoxR family ATPase [Candidatus Woesearchaeota archaeon]